MSPRPLDRKSVVKPIPKIYLELFYLYILSPFPEIKLNMCLKLVSSCLHKCFCMEWTKHHLLRGDMINCLPIRHWQTSRMGQLQYGRLHHVKLSVNILQKERPQRYNKLQQACDTSCTDSFWPVTIQLRTKLRNLISKTWMHYFICILSF